MVFSAGGPVGDHLQPPPLRDAGQGVDGAHPGERLPDAAARPGAERHQGVLRPLGLRRQPALRPEPVGFREPPLVPMRRVAAELHVGAGGNAVPPDRAVGDGAPADVIRRRRQAQRFVEDGAGIRERVVVRQGRRAIAQHGVHFLLHPIARIRMPAEEVERPGQRGAGRLVGGHQHLDHFVEHLVLAERGGRPARRRRRPGTPSDRSAFQGRRGRPGSTPGRFRPSAPSDAAAAGTGGACA